MNHKGGAGKTNTAVNLSAELAARDLRTLLIDMDPQGTSREFVTDAPVRAELADVLMKRIAVGQAVTPIETWGFSLLGGDRQALEDAETSLSRDASLIFCLGDALAEVAQDFDRVVIDCRPTLGALTQAAITASTRIIIPVDGTEALDGLIEIESLMKRLERMCDAELLGTVITKFKPRTKHFRAIKDALKNLRPFAAEIRSSVVAQELHANRLPARLYKPKSQTALDYSALAEEVEERLG